MKLRPPIDIAVRTTEQFRSAAAPIVSLLTRLVVGYAFVVAGLGKLNHFDSTIQFFTSLGIPAPAFHAGFIACLEVVGGSALMIGVATTVFAVLLSSTMVVALATAHAGDIANALTIGGKGSLTDIVAFVYLLFLAWLIVVGPGAISVDRLVGRRILQRVTPFLFEPTGEHVKVPKSADGAAAHN